MWDSKTNRFGQRFMTSLEKAKLQELQAYLMTAEPLFVLRALMEIGLREGDERFLPLLLAPELIEKWRMFRSVGQQCGEFDQFDEGYAQNLETALQQALQK